MTVTQARPHPPAGAGHSHRRPDIQGLRALAVLVVVADHLFGWPSGGFIGVDVFFVISGFLITGLMVREHERTGRISWVDFYRRRIRRIMPAATVCLIGVVTASYFLYRAARFDAIRTDAIWSFLFAANWHFAAVDTDYFKAAGPVSPLQHFWSLAVEEQFYIVWPVLLIVGLGAVGRQLRIRGRSANGLVGALIALVIIGSFVWSVAETQGAPTWAYFSTLSRAWELAVGALLALSASRLPTLPPLVRTTLMYAGLSVIIIALFVLSPRSAFPGPWAVLPVAGAAMVVAGGIGGASRFGWPLTNRIATYVGDISYSLYLWHFPVIVLLAAVLEPGTATYFVVAILGMAVLAVASFHLVEEPVRRSAWLDPNRRATESSVRRSGATSPATLVAISALAVVVLVASLFAMQLPMAPSVTARASASAASAATSSAPAGATTASGAGQPTGAAAQDLSSKIDVALQAQQWPADLNPTIDQVLDPAYTEVSPCDPGVSATATDPMCAKYPDAPKRVVVLGDSLGWPLALTVRGALGPDYDVVTYGRAWCQTVPVPKTFPDDATKDSCLTFRQQALDFVAAQHPDIVMVTNTYAAPEFFLSGAQGDAAAQEWGAALTGWLPQLVANAGKVVMVSPPPSGKRLADCATATSGPADCVTQVPDQWRQMSAAELAAADSAGAIYWDTSRWYCDAAGRCPMFAGTTIEKHDQVHPTREFSRLLIPVLQERLSTLDSPRAGGPTGTGPAEPSPVATTAQPAAAAQSDLTGQIETALQAKEWPSDLNPTIDQVLDPAYGSDKPCDTPQDRTLPMCAAFDGTTKTAVVLGDSLGWPLYFTVRAGLGSEYEVVNISRAQCQAIPIDRKFPDEDSRQGCLANRQHALDRIAEIKPDLVFITDTYSAADQLTSGAGGQAASREWRTAIDTLLSSIRADSSRVIVLTPPPFGKDLAECADQTSVPRDCASEVPDMWRTLAATERDAAAAAGAEFWDTSLWYCSPAGECPAFVGATVQRVDQIHATREYTQKLVPVFQERLGAA